VSARPSVCLSHAGIVPKRLTVYDSPGTMVSNYHRCRGNSNGVTPNGAPNRGG